MPLGASITWGYKSTHGNGYRNFLFGQLRDAGIEVDFVGSQTSGDMLDPENEGFPGKRIEEVNAEAEKDVPQYLPNIYLINAGTNDCVQDFDVDNAGVRMKDMLNYLWSVTPDATIILSTLVNNLEDAVEERVSQNFNPQIQGLVSDLAENQGKKIILAEMHGDDGPNKDEMSDDTHPSDGGYEKMANIWFREIQEAYSKGFIVEAPPMP